MRFTGFAVMAATAVSGASAADTSWKQQAALRAAAAASGGVNQSPHARALMQKALLQKATRTDNKRRLEDVGDADNNDAADQPDDAQDGQANDQAENADQADDAQGDQADDQADNPDEADDAQDQQADDQADNADQADDAQNDGPDDQEDDAQDAEQEADDAQDDQADDAQDDGANDQAEDAQDAEQADDAQDNQDADQQNQDQQDNQADGQNANAKSYQDAYDVENYPVLYEIRFQSCLALPATGDNAEQIFQYNEDMANYAAKGTIGGQKSFVLFDLCKADLGNPFSGNYLKSESNSAYDDSCDGGTYMIDLASYMEIITKEYQTSEGYSYDESYCEACAASYEFCQLGSVDNLLTMDDYEINTDLLNYLDLSLLTGDSNDASYYYDNGNGETSYSFSKVTTTDGQLLAGDKGLSLLVSCDMCSYKCGKNFASYTAPDQESGAISEATISEWAAQLNECVATESFFDSDGNFPLYLGWMCNAERDMIEPMAFLDDQCTVFEFAKTYEEIVYDTYDYTVLQQSESYIQGLFGKSYPLYATPTPMSWANALTNGEVQQFGVEEIEQQYYEAMANGGQGNNDEETFENMWWGSLVDNMAADEDLTNVFDDAIDLATCGGNYGNYQDENGSGSTTLSLQDDDMSGACSYVYNLSGKYSSVSLGSGTEYYSPVNKVVWKETELNKEAKILLMILGVMAAVCILFMIFKRLCYRKYLVRRKVTKGSDDKGEQKHTPLILA